MGQKVNAVGLRIGVNRGWNSNWFASNKDYARYLKEDMAIRSFVEKSLKNLTSDRASKGAAGDKSRQDTYLSHVEIARSKGDKGEGP